MILSRKIDTLPSSGLFALPIPGAEASGSAILAKRNVRRARQYELTSRTEGPEPLEEELLAPLPRRGTSPAQRLRSAATEQHLQTARQPRPPGRGQLAVG